MHSTEELERIAEGWRKALDPEDAWAPNIPELVAKAGREFKDVLGLHIAFLRDDEMDDDQARTEFSPLRICVRESLRDDVSNNVARLRSTLAHELGHAVLHDCMPKSRKNTGDGKVAYLAAFKNEEGEAWIFARAFLMPSWRVLQVSSARELSIRCQVSLEMAEIRFSSLKKARSPLPGIESAIARIRSATPLEQVDNRIRAEREKNTAWERARHLAGENPIRVRRSDDPGAGYRIEWRHYGTALSPYGWFVEDGRAMAYYGKDR